jgi:hypothetical protein
MSAEMPEMFLKTIYGMSVVIACSFSGKELKNVSTNKTSGWPF